MTAQQFSKGDSMNEFKAGDKVYFAFAYEWCPGVIVDRAPGGMFLVKKKRGYGFGVPKLLTRYPEDLVAR